MRSIVIILLVISFFTLYAAQAESKWVANFPKVKRIPKTWSYESTKSKGNLTYTEDYFWMENMNETNSDLNKFITDQKRLTESYMSQCKNRKIIQKSIEKSKQFDNFDSLALWSEQSGKPVYSYAYTGPNTDRSIWYLATPDQLKSASKNNLKPPGGKPFLNESLLSPDGSIGISRYVISPDGKLFCYLTTSTQDSNSGSWYFRSTDKPLMNAKTTPEGGEGRLPLIIPNGDSYSGFLWKSDSSGFFYVQNKDSYKLCYHQWGKPLSDDVIVFDTANLGIKSDNSFIYPFLSYDDRWLIVSEYADTDFKMRTYATLLTNQMISDQMKWIVLAPKNEYQMWPITLIDDWYYFQTDYQAINSKVAKIQLDFSKAKVVKKFNELTNQPNVVEVTKERKDASIPSSSKSVYAIAHNKCLVQFYENGQGTIYLYDLLTGKSLQRILPKENMYIDGIHSYSESNKATLIFESFDTPLKMYDLEYVDGKIQSNLITVQKIAGTSPTDFDVKELYATSKDGTQIPYFITSRKGTSKPGPIWLHAEGAYGDVDNLYYVAHYFSWLNGYNGYFVWAGPRGGGDEGGLWHKKGQGINKQNTFDDINAIAEDLVKRKFTTDGQIILEGGALGAIAHAAVINQARQGLIGAALFNRGPYDIFQFELRTKLGPNNMVELGDVSNPDEIDFVLKWSPYQNIKNSPYPAILVQAQKSDDQVPPSLSYKYVAKLQSDHPQSSTPLLLDMTNEDDSSSNIDGIHQICFTELTLGIKRRQK